MKEILQEFGRNIVSISILFLMTGSATVFSQAGCRLPIQSNLAALKPDPFKGTSMPDRLVAQTDIGTGVTVKRITQHSDFSSISWRVPPVHEYSKTQVWSVDNSYMSIAGGPIDVANSYSVGRIWPVAANSYWGQTTDFFYGFSYQTSKFYKVNKDGTGAILMRDFGLDGYDSSGSGTLTVGYWEGTPSADDRYVLFAGKKGGVPYMLTYDLLNDVIVGQIPQKEDLNWASVTLSGKYVVASHTTPDISGRLIWRYDLNLTNPIVIHDWSEHDCLYQDDAGDDWLFESGGTWLAIRIKDIAHVNFNGRGYGHFSTPIKKPGYIAFGIDGANGLVGMMHAVINTNIAPSPVSRNYNTMGYSGTLSFQQYTGVNEYEIWGYHRSVANNYKAFAKASVNREGTQIVVSSNWYGTGDLNDYVFSVDCSAQAPVAQFTSIQSSGSCSGASLTVNFKDASANSPTSWQWDFGDGNTSTLQNPTHSYSKVGTHLVQLIASNSTGNNTIYKSVTVSKNGTAVASGSWEFEEGSGSTTEDISGNSNTSTLFGNPVWTTGVGGSTGIAYDGVDDYLNCGIVSNINFTSPFSASVWIKPALAGLSVTGTPGVLSKANSTDGWSWQMRYETPGGSGYMGFNINTSEGEKWLPVSEVLQPGVWSHIVGTYDGSQFVCYMNGSAVDSMPVSGIVDAPNAPLLIGQEGWVQFFTGVIDNVGIYDRALCRSEILTLYNEYSTTSISNNDNNAQLIKIYPNPSNTNFTVSVAQDVNLQDAVLKVYNVCGKQVREVAIQYHQTLVERAVLNSGIYFFQLINYNSNIIGRGKLMVQ